MNRGQAGQRGDNQGAGGSPRSPAGGGGNDPRDILRVLLCELRVAWRWSGDPGYLEILRRTETILRRLDGAPPPGALHGDENGPRNTPPPPKPEGR